MQIVLTDALEKVFGEDMPRAAQPTGGAHVSGFRNEQLALQLALLPEGESVDVQVVGPLAEHTHLAAVRRVPVSSPAPENADAHYLVTEPGEYPDLLEPVTDGTVGGLTPGRWEALWIEVTGAPAGTHELVIRVNGKEQRAVVQVHDAELPPLTITNTHWFHVDSLAEYYGVDIFSEEHWALIESFLASARAMDVTSVLTPTWTPPLDTAEGHTRPFVQLVGIREVDGEYQLDLTKLDRWLEICARLGFTGLEIAHLFTQWGARHAPAIQVETADGPQHRFGWHTDATDPEYRRLLEMLIPTLREHLAAHWDGQVLWHISDEPSAEHLDAYRAAKAQVADLLEGALVVDALSSFEFAEQGVVDTPIVATDHVEPFLAAGQRPWVYYCVAQGRDVANRFIALPSVRNRVIGRQLFVAGAPGFLHWGYNFWWAQFSLRPIDPFEETCAGGAFHGGDAFMVYPGPEGTPWYSIRHRVFAQAMADHRALTWLAELTDRQTAAALVDEDGTLSYSRFSYDEHGHLAARRAVDEAILAALTSRRS
ncbi:DUF4091 domain-containing protein [Brachybacterium sp. Marseille-Q7125]|uniref:glycoside hydrolase domain-containing protein n=1 Tax=Brachybacterium sp. Marseille-Q7125 TaxID=2932815 RepID=UPI001FF68EF4